MVEVESAVGKGSTFIVTLPLNQMDAVVEKADEMVKEEETVAEENLLTDETSVEHGSQKAGVAVASPLREPAKPTMLIVDDNEDMRQFVKAHFERCIRFIPPTTERMRSVNWRNIRFRSS